MVKILWVDDEVELLKPHVLFLKQKGYEVDTCNNGYDAIDMAAEGAYDLIILDEMMPGMTGLETLPKIKEVRPTTPVIMVTKSEEENIMDKAVVTELDLSKKKDEEKKPAKKAAAKKTAKKDEAAGDEPAKKPAKKAAPMQRAVTDAIRNLLMPVILCLSEIYWSV